MRRRPCMRCIGQKGVDYGVHDRMSSGRVYLCPFALQPHIPARVLAVGCWYVNGLFPILGVCSRQGLTLADCSSRFPSQNPITNSAPQLYTQNL